MVIVQKLAGITEHKVLNSIESSVELILVSCYYSCIVFIMYFRWFPILLSHVKYKKHISR